MPVSSPTSAGLSPQARGNLHDFDDGKYPERPIPAGAGQPPSDPGIYPNRTAYPRRRGATRRLRSQRLHYIGLSPQARGNRRETDIPRRYAGPIPAGAGQPQASQRIPSSRRAYPRRRGATQFRELTDAQVEGLSPQARGNLGDLIQPAFNQRPIPAGAGQPIHRYSSEKKAGAYPRRRGATMQVAAETLTAAGLSPQARGNR